MNAEMNLNEATRYFFRDKLEFMKFLIIFNN